jgi:hypothetical protein
MIIKDMHNSKTEMVTAFFTTPRNAAVMFTLIGLRVVEFTRLYWMKKKG